MTNEDITSTIFISDSIPQYYSEYSYSSKKFIINCTMHHAVEWWKSTMVSQPTFVQRVNTYIMRPEDHFFIDRIDLAALAGITQVRIAD